MILWCRYDGLRWKSYNPKKGQRSLNHSVCSLRKQCRGTVIWIQSATLPFLVSWFPIREQHLLIFQTISIQIYVIFFGFNYFRVNDKMTIFRQFSRSSVWIDDQDRIWTYFLGWYSWLITECMVSEFGWPWTYPTNVSDLNPLTVVVTNRMFVGYLVCTLQ